MKWGDSNNEGPNGGAIVQMIQKFDVKFFGTQKNSQVFDEPCKTYGHKKKKKKNQK